MPPIIWDDDNCADNPSKIVSTGRIDGRHVFAIEHQSPNGYVLINFNGDVASSEFFNTIQKAKDEAYRQAQQNL